MSGVKSAAAAKAAGNASVDDEKWMDSLCKEMTKCTGFDPKATAAGDGDKTDKSAADSKRMRIYTKTGDTGSTSLYNNKRALKSQDYFEALGDVDELNAHIGVCYDRLTARGTIVGGGGLFLLKVTTALWMEISSRLMDVGSHLATPLSSSNDVQIERAAFDPAHITVIEKSIDQVRGTSLARCLLYLVVLSR